MFRNWQSWGARDLAVTADSLTGDEIAATVERVTGTPCQYHSMPPNSLRSTMPGIGHDYAAMFQFFRARDILGLDRDLTHLRELHPEMMTFEDWLRATAQDTTEDWFKRDRSPGIPRTVARRPDPELR
ncbi:NmrA family NAD(P)-binding protein [Nocardia jiangxiensis]|uniref:NmrA-like domain-containing protein n=1 Tax=Nocardia jiangxiensis TaxID=282685 RepID=A0ABW6S408_9NOCA|nr:hypothetical protein [Nocardia jiangxiensis]